MRGIDMRAYTNFPQWFDVLKDSKRKVYILDGVLRFIINGAITVRL